MAGSKDREVIKTYDFSNFDLMSPEEREQLSQAVSAQARIKIDIHEVLLTLKNLAASDITEFIEEDGNGNITLMKGIKNLPLAQRQQIKELNLVTKRKYGKDGQLVGEDTHCKIALYDKIKVLEHIQKHLDMWGENTAGGTGSDKIQQFFDEVDSFVKKATDRKLEVDGGNEQ